MAELTETDIREHVRERYARRGESGRREAALAAAPYDLLVQLFDIEHGNGFSGATLDEGERDAAPQLAIDASLGCGVPTAVADLHEGETVLDLGSGAGADVLISSRRVGPTGGGAIGVLDMTDEMLELAQAKRRGGGRRERRVPQGLHPRTDPASRRVGRRRDLELRHQPGRRRQAQGARSRPHAPSAPAAASPSGT